MTRQLPLCCSAKGKVTAKEEVSWQTSIRTRLRNAIQAHPRCYLLYRLQARIELHLSSIYGSGEAPLTLHPKREPMLQQVWARHFLIPKQHPAPAPPCLADAAFPLFPHACFIQGIRRRSSGL